KLQRESFAGSAGNVLNSPGCKVSRISSIAPSVAARVCNQYPIEAGAVTGCRPGFLTQQKEGVRSLGLSHTQFPTLQRFLAWRIGSRRELGGGNYAGFVAKP